MAEQGSICIEPGAIAAGDLIASARGEASTSVQSHIERCPACRAQRDAYAGLDQTLRTQLYRRSCPLSVTLGEYAMGMLPPIELQHIAEHLVDCPRCAAESRSFSAFLAEPDEPPQERGVLSALRRLLAQPLPNPEPALSGLRGTAGDETITYAANGLRLTVSVQQSSAGRHLLVGLIEQEPEAYFGASALLYSGDRLVQSEPVDDLGSFLFENVPSGDYRIEVKVPEAVVVIDSLRVT